MYDVGNECYVVPLSLYCRVAHSGYAVCKALGHDASRQHAMLGDHSPHCALAHDPLMPLV
jgi:hypothetical protein